MIEFAPSFYECVLQVLWRCTTGVAMPSRFRRDQIEAWCRKRLGPPLKKGKVVYLAMDVGHAKARRA